MIRPRSWSVTSEFTACARMDFGLPPVVFYCTKIAAMWAEHRRWSSELLRRVAFWLCASVSEEQTAWNGFTFAIQLLTPKYMWMSGKTILHHVASRHRLHNAKRNPENIWKKVELKRPQLCWILSLVYQTHTTFREFDLHLSSGFYTTGYPSGLVVGIRFVFKGFRTCSLPLSLLE
jgi:hypothetical protein